MGKLVSDIAYLKRKNKRRIGDDKKQEIKPKRKKRKKDLEKLRRNGVEASKSSFTRVYRNGAKGKEIRKGNLPESKFYKARLQGEVAKLLDRDTSKKSTNLFESSSEILHIDLENKEKQVVEEDSVSSEDDTQCLQKVLKKQSTTSRKFPWSAMFRYEEFCAIICSENFDGHSILSELPDPLQKVKESLKRVHTNAIRQHFSRPDMDKNDYIINLKNQDSPNTLADETDNIQIESRLSDHISNTSLTADTVGDSHPETSQKITSEVEDKSNNILFSISNEQPEPTRKTNVNAIKNFQLPLEIFSQPSSMASSTLTGNDSIIERNYSKHANCDIDNVKCNARFEKHDKHIFKNCSKYIVDVEAQNTLSDIEKGKRFTFTNDFSKRNISPDCTRTQKYIEDLLKHYKSRRTIQDAIDINNREHTIAWKNTKSLKHVPAILRRSAYDPTSLSDLTFTSEKKSNNANPKETSKKDFYFNLNVCPLRSSNNTKMDVPRAKANKRSEKQHRVMKEKPSTSTYQTEKFTCHIPLEANVEDKSKKLHVSTKDFNKYAELRPQKSVTFTKGILLNTDAATTQLHYEQSRDTTKPASVNKLGTTIHPVNYQPLEGNQHLLLNPEQIHQPNVTFIQPTQYIEPSQNSCCTNESVPVYLQIINQPMKAHTEHNMTNPSLINKPVTTFATCGQTLSNQSITQQPVVPVTSKNVQFMLRENDPRLYAFSELQNLKLLTLNDSQNMYVGTLNSSHEQKRANECVMLHNVNQPTKYLAFEKDLNTQRIPIYLHNSNDETVTQQYLPCKVVTAVEKQNNDKMFIHEPSSRVILVQGSNLHDRDRQFIDPNYKNLI